MLTDTELDEIIKTLPEFASTKHKREFPARFREWLACHEKEKEVLFSEPPKPDAKSINRPVESIGKLSRKLYEYLMRPGVADAIQEAARFSRHKDKKIQEVGVLNHLHHSIALLLDASEIVAGTPGPDSSPFEIGRWYALIDLSNLYRDTTGLNPGEKEEAYKGIKYGPFAKFARASLKLIYGDDCEKNHLFTDYYKWMNSDSS